MSRLEICALPQPGLIRFSGEEAQTFLHNQLSCDVSAVTLGRCSYGAYCTAKGRVLASFLLWRSEAGFFMQLPSSLREGVKDRLSKFILRSKVKVADASADWTVFGVAGDDAATLVRRTIGQAPTEVHDVAHAEGLTVIRLPRDRYEIVTEQNKAAQILGSLAASADKAAPGRWEWLDIRAGIPVILATTQEQFVPQMVNLDLIGGVSFEKGCYPGQEIVARMHFRGTLKQRMYLANIAGTGHPQPGDKLYSADFGEQSCGTIVNAAPSPEGGYDVLAVIQISAIGRGSVRWNSLAGAALTLLTLPYNVA